MYAKISRSYTRLIRTQYRQCMVISENRLLTVYAFSNSLYRYLILWYRKFNRQHYKMALFLVTEKTREKIESKSKLKVA